MLPPVDTHVHLLAGLDDGPETADEADAMCRMLVAEGARSAAALAHQNDGYLDNTPDALRAATADLAARLKDQKIPLAVYPTGEVMVTPDLVAKFHAGQLLTVADRGKFLLVEMPHALFVDLLPIAAALRPKGVRLIVAHAERYPELLHGGSLVERYIAAGCLIQVTAQQLAEPPSAADAKVLKDWVTRGIVHMVGSDGHRLTHRPPRLRAGMETLIRWAGPGTADRIGNLWASLVLQGRPVNPPPPKPRNRSWFGKLLGG